jgi:hypothetical protein
LTSSLGRQVSYGCGLDSHLAPCLLQCSIENDENTQSDDRKQSDERIDSYPPKQEAKEKMKKPETTTLVIHDASAAKSKYATSATLANTTINPYGIKLTFRA